MNDDFDSACRDAVDALKRGSIIAYPTEAVYGLGCDPRNETALQRIIELKGREAHKGFILVASSQAQLAEFLAPVEPAWQALFDQHWPGPVTFVAPVAANMSGLLSGFRDTLAVRVSAHSVVRSLCDCFDGPIVSTSANRSGQAALVTGQQVVNEFGDGFGFVVDGDVGALASPTRILDVRDGRVLR